MHWGILCDYVNIFVKLGWLLKTLSLKQGAICQTHFTHRPIIVTPQSLLRFMLVGNDKVTDHMPNFNYVHFLQSHNNRFHVAGGLNSSVLIKSKWYSTLPTSALALVDFFSEFFLKHIFCKYFWELVFLSNLLVYLFSLHFIWNGIFYYSITENIFLYTY